MRGPKWMCSNLASAHIPGCVAAAVLSLQCRMFHIATEHSAASNTAAEKLRSNYPKIIADGI